MKKVIEILRRDVPRPKTLPKPDDLIGRNYLRWGSKKGFCCPMGLHKKANSNNPIGALDFPLGVGSEDISEFADWWDKQTDPKKAMDRVWGKT